MNVTTPKTHTPHNVGVRRTKLGDRTENRPARFVIHNNIYHLFFAVFADSSHSNSWILYARERFIELTSVSVEKLNDDTPGEEEEKSRPSLSETERAFILVLLLVSDIYRARFKHTDTQQQRKWLKWK